MKRKEKKNLNLLQQSSDKASFAENKKLWQVLCGLLLLVSVAFFLFRLGDAAFLDYDEATYAQVTKELGSTGDPLSLTYLSENWFEKPPLYFWAADASSRVFEDKEFAYRFPAAVAGVLTVALVMLIMLTVTESSLAAFFAGVVILTMGGFYEAAREVRLDVPVSAAILFSFYAFLRGKKNPLWYLGVGVGIGIGIMFKSVIALLVVFPILFWSFLHKDFKWLLGKYLWIGVALGLAIILPWHVYEISKFGSVFTDNYFIKHVFHRFQDNIIESDTTTRDYLRYGFLLALPWSAALFAGLFPFFKKGRSGEKKRMAQVFLFSTIAIFFFFAAAQTKLLYYIVPMYPFLALSVAYMLFVLYSDISSEKYRKVFFVVFAVLFCFGVRTNIHIGFYHFAGFEVNHLVAEEEKELAQFIVKKPEIKKIYAYHYPYWETIRYYNGGRNITEMKDDQVLDEPFFLLVSTPFINASHFPPELEKHLTVEYKGEAVTLYSFQP